MEPQRLGGLIDRLAPALELYARQWSDAPEDVVQEAFLALAGLIPSPDNPAAWLFRATRNGAINHGIAGRRRRHHEAEAASAAPAWFEPDRTGPGADSPVDPDAAQAALSTLPVEQREVIIAHLWGGLTFHEIARVAGTSASTAHRHYGAGLIALRGRLGVPCRSTANRSNPNSDRK